jgi:hypothetical protein
VIDAPLPGIGDWENIVRNPALWHFDFRGPDEERLVLGNFSAVCTLGGGPARNVARLHIA